MHGARSPPPAHPHAPGARQVVGRKYVRLVAPAHGAAMYPHAGGSLHTNTSRVDARTPDAAAFPLYAHAPHAEAVLSAGDMLFIPRGWWHYVLALSASFSTSFWWD